MYIYICGKHFGMANIKFRDKKRYSGPVTGLEWPRVFQEVKVPRLRDNGTGWS